MVRSLPIRFSRSLGKSEESQTVHEPIESLDLHGTRGQRVLPRVGPTTGPPRTAMTVPGPVASPGKAFLYTYPPHATTIPKYPFLPSPSPVFPRKRSSIREPEKQKQKSKCKGASSPDQNLPPASGRHTRVFVTGSPVHLEANQLREKKDSETGSTNQKVKSVQTQIHDGWNQAAIWKFRKA